MTKIQKYDTKAYMDSVTNYREQLILALEVANDPFKAPELTVHTAHAVQKAAWQMQVEYAAMMHYKDNIKDAT